MPPPLPPKKRNRAHQLLDESESVLSSSLDRISLRSRSPEDSSSLLSASAGSLDSALNHSRDEDEIRAIMGPNDESLNDSMDLNLVATIHGKKKVHTISPTKYNDKKFIKYTLQQFDLQNCFQFSSWADSIQIVMK